MKLEDQVTSLELSKRLKELRVKQESLYFWAVEMKKRHETDKWSLCVAEHLLPEHPKYSAFTVSELGEILPSEIITNRSFRLRTYKWEGDNAKYSIGYWDMENNLLHDEFEKTEANVRAKLLSYLLENRIVDLSVLI